MTDSPAAPAVMPLEIYTDGSCNPNPGRGGWGFVAVQGGRSINELFGGEPRTTNNRMEITAIIQGLLSIPPGTSTTIVSDSQLAINVISGNWRAKANRDLVKDAQTLVEERQITFRWVRGHDGDRWNERADALATQGMAKGTSKRGKSPASPVERTPQRRAVQKADEDREKFARLVALVLEPGEAQALNEIAKRLLVGDCCTGSQRTVRRRIEDAVPVAPVGVTFEFEGRTIKLYRSVRGASSTAPITVTREDKR